MSLERGETLSSTLCHDILSNSVIFDGEATRYPDKWLIVPELEKVLDADDTSLIYDASSCLKTAVIGDFISIIRSRKLSSSGTFSTAVQSLYSEFKEISRKVE